MTSSTAASPSSPTAQAQSTPTTSTTTATASRARLTEEEKKSNHIASEQKRRMAIREGFDRLTELVPGIEGMGRSESLVLQRTVEYMKKLTAEEEELSRRAEMMGGVVPKDEDF